MARGWSLESACSWLVCTGGLLGCLLLPDPSAQAQQASFSRGDASGDGVIDVADPLTILFRVFVAPVELSCEDAADSDDSGRVDAGDALYLLRRLFLSGPAFPPPVTCGEDSTEDTLDCVAFEPCSDDRAADVIEITTTGAPGAYTFRVTVASPDTGCDQYADWWEVISPAGELIHRRVLAHSHVGEQPFSRSSGPVPVDVETEVIVRAHMNTAGYGGQALRGSVAAGFEPVTLDPAFAADLAEQPPLPTSCAF